MAAAKGVSQAQLARRLTPLLPANSQVRTSDEQAQQGAKQVSSGLSSVRTFLLVFGGIALFVGAFVIFNTISITVAQRARELATLRTLGASRRQVLRSVVIETLIIGVVASAIGMLAGLGIAKGLDALFTALGAELPKAGTVLAAANGGHLDRHGHARDAARRPVPRASAPPACRRSQRSARARCCRRRGSPPPGPTSRPRRSCWASPRSPTACSPAAAPRPCSCPWAPARCCCSSASPCSRSHLVRPLAALVGRPARSLGGSAGRLAAQNAVRNPGRTASTAAALMIGLALVTFVATLGAGLRSAFADSLNTQIRAGHIVSPSGNAEAGVFPVAAGRAVATTPGVTVASSVRSDKAPHPRRDDRRGRRGPGDDRAGLPLRAQARRRACRAGHGRDAARRLRQGPPLAIGSRLTLQTPSGSKRTLPVTATYKPAAVEGLISGIVIGQATFDRAFPQPRNAYTFVAGTASSASLAAALARYPDAKLDTKAAWIASDQKDLDKTLMLLYVLLALSVIVSLFGMVNTMILSVFERTRELGMLRAIGMSRRQARRMIRQESVITALIGAALGLPLGLFLAAIVTRGLSDQGIGFHLPLGPLVAFTRRRGPRPASSRRSLPPAAPHASTSCTRSSTSEGRIGRPG